MRREMRVLAPRMTVASFVVLGTLLPLRAVASPAHVASVASSMRCEALFIPGSIPSPAQDSRSEIPNRYSGLPRGTAMYTRPITETELFMFEVAEHNRYEYGLWYLLDTSGKVVHEGRIYGDKEADGVHIDSEGSFDGNGTYLGHLAKTLDHFPTASTLVFTHPHPGLFGEVDGRNLIFINWIFSPEDLRAYNLIRARLDRIAAGNSRFARLKFEGYIIYRNHLTRKIKKKGISLGYGDRINVAP